MLPTFPNFTPIQREHQPILESYTHPLPPYSDYTFPSLWCWNHDEQLSLAEFNGNLVLCYTDYFTKKRVLSFLGQQAIATTVIRLFAEINTCSLYLPELRLVPATNLTPLDLPDGYTARDDRDNADYVYNLTELAAMRGRVYQEHRNFINRFNKNYSWDVQSLDLHLPQTWQDIDRVFAIWRAEKDKIPLDVTLDVIALRKVRQLVGQVALMGLGVYVEGQLVGYTINEPNQCGFATNLFEHGDTRYIGIFKVLKQQTAQLLLQHGYQYWSHQQDWGLPGLRQAKKSFNPEFFLHKWVIQQGN